MILFAEDWQRYPTAIVDIQTRNKSFLRLASVYRGMGVRNHAFMLALVNPALQGIDPHAKDLTPEQILMIAAECKINPWYYFREVARAPGSAGADTDFVEGNRGNVAAWWLFFNHVMFTLIQPRQTGKSFSIDQLMVWLLDVGAKGCKINLLTKDDTLRRANIDRLKSIREEMPFYLCQRTPNDINNTEELTVDRLSNRYTTHVPQSSPKRAMNLGRGLTTPVFQIDEPPFQANIGIALPAALPAMGAATDLARKAGAPYGVIFTTTAGKKDDRDGKWFYNEILSLSALWTERFFDCQNQKALELMIRANARTKKGQKEAKVMVNLTMNHRQLGKTDAWLMKKLEDALQSGDDSNRDYFNMWTSGSMSHPLPINILEAISGSMEEPLYTEVSGSVGYIIRWYIHEEEIVSRMATGKYVMGMDTSDASGGDDISMVITDVETLEVVAAGNFNETNIITFSEWVASLLIRFVNVTAVVERKSTGVSLLDYLLLYLPQSGIDPFRRLFNTVVQCYDEDPDAYTEIRQPMHRRDPDCYVRYKRAFGYTTSASGMMSRGELYGPCLQLGGRKAADGVRDKTLIDQINGLVTKNGRIDHADGEHDDLVIGWLLGLWLCIKGKNLSHYGIDPKMIMSQVGADLHESSLDKMRRLEQVKLRDEIQAMSELIAGTKDDYLAERYEQQIRVLARQVEYEDNEIFSVDELIRQTREKRKVKNNARFTEYSRNVIQQHVGNYAQAGMVQESFYQRRMY